MTIPHSKAREAANVLQRAREAGCVAILTNDWVVFRPAPPPDIVLDASRLAKELYAIVSKECPCCQGKGKIQDTEFFDGDETTCMTCNGSGSQ